MTQLTLEQCALLPSDEEVAAFHERGYYVSRKIFTDQEIDAALRGSERFYSGDVDATDAYIPERWYPDGDYQGLRKHDYASLLNRELAHLARHPLLGAIAARLSGSPLVRLWHDQLLYKPVDNPDAKSNVGWHTDLGYWKTCSSPDMLTAWIPFHDCNEEQGTITMIEGSNHWPDNTEKLDFSSNDLEALEREFDSGGQPVVKAPMNLKKGHVSFHHCRTIHGSGPNRGEAPRRSIAVHLQPADNRWQETRLQQGRLAVHNNDALVRQTNGVPDYTDPTYCPVIYNEEESSCN